MKELSNCITYDITTNFNIHQSWFAVEISEFMGLLRFSLIF